VNTGRGLTLSEIAIGLIGALVAGSVIESLLFGITGREPLAFGAARFLSHGSVPPGGMALAQFEFPAAQQQLTGLTS
jgi:hypothetical protein